MASTQGERQLFDNKKIYGQEKGTRRINLSDLKLEVLSQDFVQRVEEPQLMSVGRNQSTT